MTTSQSLFARSVGSGLGDPFATNHMVSRWYVCSRNLFPKSRVPKETRGLSGWLPATPVDSDSRRPPGKSKGRFCSQMRHSMRTCQVIPEIAAKVGSDVAEGVDS